MELRVDEGPGLPGRHARGAVDVATSAIAGARNAGTPRHVVVNGTAGVLETVDGRPVALLAFTIRGDRVATIDILTDPARLARLAPTP